MIINPLDTRDKSHIVIYSHILSNGETFSSNSEVEDSEILERKSMM